MSVSDKCPQNLVEVFGQMSVLDKCPVTIFNLPTFSYTLSLKLFLWMKYEKIVLNFKIWEICTEMGLGGCWKMLK